MSRPRFEHRGNIPDKLLVVVMHRSELHRFDKTGMPGLVFRRNEGIGDITDKSLRQRGLVKAGDFLAGIPFHDTGKIKFLFIFLGVGKGFNKSRCRVTGFELFLNA